MYRPLRPYFYKPVAILGVPLRDWKVSLAATVLSAVFLFFFWRSMFGIPVWFVGSLGLGLGSVAFFLWAHNSHRRGWLEYAIRYYWRIVNSTGETLLPARVGKRNSRWLVTDGRSSKTAQPKWLKKA